MKEETQRHLPEELLSLRLVVDNQWEFVYPRIGQQQWEQFYEVQDLWSSGIESNISKSERGYRSLLKTYPEFIDAYHHLAILLDETDRSQQAFKMWQRSVDISLGCFPPNFSIGQDLLPWILLNNRPFLRAYHGLGLAFMGRGEIKNALSIFTALLSLNPDDNQGIRSMAIHCNFALNRPWDVLGTTQQFPEDILAGVIYCRVLALYQMGLEQEAKTALGEAIKDNPLVAKEIVKKRHRRPKELYPGYIIVGGLDDAYHYWIEYGQYWKNTPGAIDFVRDYLSWKP